MVVKRAHSPDIPTPTSTSSSLLLSAGPSPKRRTKSNSSQGSSSAEQPEEKRLAQFKKQCPKETTERVARVRSQRFFCVDRERTGATEEQFKVLGSTGNVYTIIIETLPKCSCPDGAKGNRCKHILFVFIKVLGVPLGSNLYYQKALLTSELESIFAHAPRAPQDVTAERLRSLYRVASGQEAASASTSSGTLTRKRLPEAGDACPVCYEDFTDGQDTGLVFCLTIKGCGNGIHQECFDQWAARTNPITCVNCRAEWPKSTSTAKAGPSYSAEGYLNMASSVGLSQKRDTSSYYHGPQRGRRWDGGHGRYD